MPEDAEKPPAFIPPDLPALARHEAGHAVLTVAFGSTLKNVSISPEQNRGKVHFHPSMGDGESRAACDFAGPLSQMLRYPDSVREYRDACLRSIVFEQPDRLKIPDIPAALGWGNDLRFMYGFFIGMREQFPLLETALKSYLERESIQRALAEVEEALLKDHEPDPQVIERIITSELTEDDYSPSLCSGLRACHFSDDVTEYD